jgi:hypothetical protein
VLARILACICLGFTRFVLNRHREMLWRDILYSLGQLSESQQKRVLDPALADELRCLRDRLNARFAGSAAR